MLIDTIRYETLLAIGVLKTKAKWKLPLFCFYICKTRAYFWVISNWYFLIFSGNSFHILNENFRCCAYNFCEFDFILTSLLCHNDVTDNVIIVRSTKTDNFAYARKEWSKYDKFNLFLRQKLLQFSKVSF